MAMFWRWPPDMAPTWRVSEMPSRRSLLSTSPLLHLAFGTSHPLARPPWPGQFAAKKQVLDSIQIVAEGEILIDGLYAQIGRT